MKTEYDATLKYSPEYLRECDDEELAEMIQSAQQVQLDMRTLKAQRFGDAEKPHLFKKVRRDIARMRTAWRKI